MAIHVPFSQRPSGQPTCQRPIYIGFDQPRRHRRKINWWGVNSVLLFFISAGALSPVTLLMGLAGLRKAPRTAAATGTLLSLFGVLAMTGIVYAAVTHAKSARFARAVAIERQETALQVAATKDQLTFAASEFEQYRDDHQGKLPLDLDGNSLAIKHVDPWGESFRYEVQAEGATLRSAGPDNEFLSGDDVTHSMHGKSSWQPLLPVK